MLYVIDPEIERESIQKTAIIANNEGIISTEIKKDLPYPSTKIAKHYGGRGFSVMNERTFSIAFFIRGNQGVMELIDYLERHRPPAPDDGQTMRFNMWVAEVESLAMKLLQPEA